MSDRGPFEGYPELTDGAWVARALMAMGPVLLDHQFATRPIIDSWVRIHGPTKDRWLLHRHDGMLDRYTLETSGGEGFSRATPPPGEEIAIVVDTSGQHPVTERYRLFCKRYSEGAYGAPDPAVLDRQRLALESLEPTYGERAMRPLVDLLAERGQKRAGDRPSERERAMRLAVQLADLRERLIHRYLAFSTTAWVVAAANVVTSVTSHAAGTVDGEFANFEPNIYLRVAEAMRDGRDLTPDTVVANTLSATVKSGAKQSVLAAGEAFRDLTDEAIERALDAADARVCANALYSALPTAMSAFYVYAHLAASESEDARWQTVRKVTDEKVVRIAGSLGRVIADLDGKCWRADRSEVNRARMEGGDEAAARTARALIDEELFYPRSLLSALLAQ
jgi:hypothetical protein